MNDTTINSLYEEYRNLDKKVSNFKKLHSFDGFKPNIGVFGENSVGKSTFLNTIVENKNQFKSGFGETTDKVTILYKGVKPRFINSIEHSFVQENYTPLDYFNLYDIPGYGKRYSHNHLQVILKELDVVLWLVNASTGIKKSDTDFLNHLANLKSNSKIIVIYNRIDSIIHELDTHLSINEDIKNVKQKFIDLNLTKDLIAVIPFSGRKSLVNIIKEEGGSFSEVNRIMKGILYYVSFCDSLDKYITSLFEPIQGYKTSLTKPKIESKTNEWIKIASNKLEYKLKDEISCLSSLNPFGSKNEEANRYVEIALKEINNQLQQSYILEVKSLQSAIQSVKEKLVKYEVFSSKEVSIKYPNYKSLNVDVGLSSLAWDSFWGDSFAEDVSSKFQRKAKREFTHKVDDLIKLFEMFQEQTTQYLETNISQYKNELEDSLQGYMVGMEKLIAYLLFFTLKKP
ncbi:MAG TPA: GTP-binding protein [Arcobacter sp.]|nr:GTP-binding protein [Arcobacter sp.]